MFKINKNTKVIAENGKCAKSEISSVFIIFFFVFRLNMGKHGPKKNTEYGQISGSVKLKLNYG